MKKKRILINTSEGRYPILIGENLISKLGNLLKKNNIFSSKIFLVIDKNVPIKMVKLIKNSINNKFFFCLLKIKREK